MSYDNDLEKIISIYKHSTNHKDKLINDHICGCFYCLEIFSPKKMEEWVTDIAGTAICPYCGVDSIIGESSGYPITNEFLKQMHKVKF